MNNLNNKKKSISLENFYKETFKSKNKKLSTGFTLVELLLVIAIIGLITGIILTNLPQARESARVTNALKFSQTMNNSIGVDLVASWGMDEGVNESCSEGKDICDKSGYFNHGQNHGANWDSDTPAKKNYSIFFNSSGDYIDIVPNLGLNLTNKTIEFWVNTTQNNTGLIGQKSTSPGWIITIDNGHIKYRDFANSSTIEGDKVINDGKWHHIVVVAPASNTGNVIYIDGKTDKKQIVNNSGSSGNIYIGSCAQISAGVCLNGYFIGKMDEVRIYGRAMNASEVGNIYAQEQNKLVCSL